VDSGSPTDTSIPAIAFWIRGKIGTLNTLLYEDFAYDPVTLELTANGGELSYEAIAIIKQLYRVYDCDLQIRKQMNALNADSIISWEDQGTAIRKVNRNTVSQTYVMLRKEELKTLTDMITAYRNRSSQPSQVSGDDILAGFLPIYPGYYPSYIRR
jgi:hypothetical protein